MKNILQKIALVGLFCAVLGAFAALAFVLSGNEDTEAKLAKVLLDDENKIAQAFFSPDDELKNLLIGLIDVEKKSIAIAIYTLTDKDITRALKHAYERGVTIEFVVDPGYGNDRYSKIDQLANEGIPIWVYQSSSDERSSSLMHNKFAIFEDSIDHHSLVWTGSFNFTVRAHERNQENVVILDNKRIVKRFINQFDVLKKRSLLINENFQSIRARKAESKKSRWVKKIKKFF